MIVVYRDIKTFIYKNLGMCDVIKYLDSYIA